MTSQSGAFCHNEHNTYLCCVVQPRHAKKYRSGTNCFSIDATIWLFVLQISLYICTYVLFPADDWFIALKTQGGNTVLKLLLLLLLVLVSCYCHYLCYVIFLISFLFTLFFCTCLSKDFILLSHEISVISVTFHTWLKVGLSSQRERVFVGLAAMQCFPNGLWNMHKVVT